MTIVYPPQTHVMGVKQTHFIAPVELHERLRDLAYTTRRKQGYWLNEAVRRALSKWDGPSPAELPPPRQEGARGRSVVFRVNADLLNRIGSLSQRTRVGFGEFMCVALEELISEYEKSVTVSRAPPMTSTATARWANQQEAQKAESLLHRLCDGERTAQEVADMMGWGVEKARAAIRKHGLNVASEREQW